MNYYSKENKWRSVVKPETKEKELKAIELKRQGYNVKTIAAMLFVSTDRVYQYLKSENGKH